MELETRNISNEELRKLRKLPPDVEYMEIVEEKKACLVGIDMDDADQQRCLLKSQDFLVLCSVSFVIYLSLISLSFFLFYNLKFGKIKNIWGSSSLLSGLFPNDTLPRQQGGPVTLPARDVLKSKKQTPFFFFNFWFFFGFSFFLFSCCPLASFFLCICFP